MSTEDKEAIAAEITKHIKENNRWWGITNGVIIAVCSGIILSVFAWGGHFGFKKVGSWDDAADFAKADKVEHDSLSRRNIAQDRLNTIMSDSIWTFSGRLEAHEEAIISIQGRLLKSHIR